MLASVQNRKCFGLHTKIGFVLHTAAGYATLCCMDAARAQTKTEPIPTARRAFPFVTTTFQWIILTRPISPAHSFVREAERTT